MPLRKKIKCIGFVFFLRTIFGALTLSHLLSFSLHFDFHFLSSRSKDATNGAPGLTTRSKKLLSTSFLLVSTSFLLLLVRHLLLLAMHLFLVASLLLFLSCFWVLHFHFSPAPLTCITSAVAPLIPALAVHIIGIKVALPKAVLPFFCRFYAANLRIWR